MLTKSKLEKYEQLHDEIEGKGKGRERRGSSEKSRTKGTRQTSRKV